MKCRNVKTQHWIVESTKSLWGSVPYLGNSVNSHCCCVTESLDMNFLSFLILSLYYRQRPKPGHCSPGFKFKLPEFWLLKTMGRCWINLKRSQGSSASASGWNVEISSVTPPHCRLSFLNKFDLASASIRWPLLLLQVMIYIICLSRL